MSCILEQFKPYSCIKNHKRNFSSCNMAFMTASREANVCFQQKNLEWFCRRLRKLSLQVDFYFNSNLITPFLWVNWPERRVTVRTCLSETVLQKNTIILKTLLILTSIRNFTMTKLDFNCCCSFSGDFSRNAKWRHWVFTHILQRLFGLFCFARFPLWLLFLIV